MNLTALQGNERWVEDLEHKFHKEFVAAKSKPWVADTTGHVAGEVRVAGKGAGSVTFVQVYEAGHMVPFDQPEHALVSDTSAISGGRSHCAIQIGHV